MQNSQVDLIAERNLLLRALPGNLCAKLKEQLEPVGLPVGTFLVKANLDIDYVYFITSGIASETRRTSHGELELGVIGREGMSSLAILLETSRTPHDTYMQVGGSALRMPSKLLHDLFRQDENIRTLLLKYIQHRNIQTAETVIAAGRFNIKERTARWLLMCHDRLDTDLIPITHEFLGLMLGVRRAGVTDSLHLLEGVRSIRSTRGWIEIRDRAVLEDIAADSYGAPEAEYARLIGPWLRPLRSD